MGVGVWQLHGAFFLLHIAMAAAVGCVSVGEGGCAGYDNTVWRVVSRVLGGVLGVWHGGVGLSGWAMWSGAVLATVCCPPALNVSQVLGMLQA